MRLPPFLQGARGLLLRLLVSGGLIALLFWKMDAAAVFRQWRNIQPGPFALGVLLLAASNLVGSIQWLNLLRAQDLRPRTGQVLGSYHAGLFFSNFLPGHYGGDAVRVFDMYRETGEGYRALAATFVDRLLGLVSLCLLALAVAPAFLRRGETVELAALGVACAALAAVVVVFSSRRVARPLSVLLRPFRAGLVERVRSGYDAIHLYRRRPRTLAGALLLSLLVQCLRVLVHYETALAVNVHIHVANFFLLVPIIAILIAMPVSMNGIGVREGAGVLFFRHVGVDAEPAFALLFLAYLAGVLVSIPGGVVFALRRGSAAAPWTRGEGHASMSPRRGPPEPPPTTGASLCP